MRSHYWSCSNFADWLRGTVKPSAATSRGWRDWRINAQTAHRVRYWLAEEGLDMLQNALYWPADQLANVRYYINNRWVSRSHALTAHPRDIKPGRWCDVGHRFLPCLFNELVDFVEVETAWHHVLWDKEEREKYQVPWWRVNYLRWRTWRCPEAGIAHLEWASTLTHVDSKGVEHPTGQAHTAKEILDLYHWWTEEYPNRPDPHDVSGWTEHCSKKRKDGDDLFDFENETPAQKKTVKKMLKETDRIEKQYAQEDEQMMIRLIKIRSGLWT